jgi:hypothetical protein
MVLLNSTRITAILVAASVQGELKVDAEIEELLLLQHNKKKLMIASGALNSF